MPPYDWANSGSADVFFGVVSMFLLLWELVLFYRMGVEFQGQNFLELLQESEMAAECHCRNWT